MIWRRPWMSTSRRRICTPSLSKSWETRSISTTFRSASRGTRFRRKNSRIKRNSTQQRSRDSNARIWCSSRICSTRRTISILSLRNLKTCSSKRSRARTKANSNNNRWTDWIAVIWIWARSTSNSRTILPSSSKTRPTNLMRCGRLRRSWRHR